MVLDDSLEPQMLRCSCRSLKLFPPYSQHTVQLTRSTRLQHRIHCDFSVEEEPNGKDFNMHQRPPIKTSNVFWMRASCTAILVCKGHHHPPASHLLHCVTGLPLALQI
jgi:hypothetical protein